MHSNSLSGFFKVNKMLSNLHTLSKRRSHDEQVKSSTEVVKRFDCHKPHMTISKKNNRRDRKKTEQEQLVPSTINNEYRTNNMCILYFHYSEAN